MKDSFNYLIIDDDAIDMTILQSHLSKLPQLKLIQTFNNPIDAIPTIHEGFVDLIFSDIEMPEMTGIELINSLGKNRPQVVLISNYVLYSTQAFEIGAIDFIHKPVTFIRLLKSVNRAIDAIILKSEGA